MISNNDIFIDDKLLLSKLANYYDELKDCAFIAPIMWTKGRISMLSAWKIPSFWDDVVDSLRMTNMLFGGNTSYKISNMANAPVEVDCLSGAFFMGTYDTFKLIGFMDENTFLYGEEVILAKKVKMARLRNFIIPSLNYEHQNSGTISTLISSVQARKHLTESRVYYHLTYFNGTKLKGMILRGLFTVWKLENYFYCLLKATLTNVMTKVR